MNGHLLIKDNITSLILGGSNLINTAYNANCLYISLFSRYSAQYTILGEGYSCKLFDGCELNEENILKSNGIVNGVNSYTKLDNDNAVQLPGTILLVKKDKNPNCNDDR